MERKPRKKPKNRKIDYMKPLTLKDFGTDRDPCFGKHYDLKAEECSRCGDYEACSIVTQSRMIQEVKEQEEKHPFKDTAEGMLINAQNEWARKQLVKKATGRDTWLSIEKFVPKFRKYCNLTEKEDANLYQRVLNAAKASKKLEVKGGKYRKKIK